MSLFFQRKKKTANFLFINTNLLVPHRSTNWLRSTTLSLLRAFTKNSILKYWQPRKHSNLPNSYGNPYTQKRFGKNQSNVNKWLLLGAYCEVSFLTLVPFSLWSMHKSSHLLVNFCCRCSSARANSMICCRFISKNRYRNNLSIFRYSAHFALNVTKIHNLSTGEKKNQLLGFTSWQDSTGGAACMRRVRSRLQFKSFGT